MEGKERPNRRGESCAAPTINSLKMKKQGMGPAQTALGRANETTLTGINIRILRPKK